MSKADTGKAIKCAKDLVEELFIERPEHIDIKAIAMTQGATVIEAPVKGAEGRLSSIGDECFISIREDIEEPRRKRFIAAHELGHFLLHQEISLSFNCTDGDLNSWSEYQPFETEANYFASEILMPEKLISPKISGKDVSLKLLNELSEEFDTSMTATAIRFASLRSDYALIYSEDSTIKRFHKDDSFPYYLNAIPGSPLHRDSYAYSFFKGEDPTDYLFPVPSEAWFDDSRIKPNDTVKELVIGSRRYNYALSFLYIEEDDEDYDDSYDELDGEMKFR